MDVIEDRGPKASLARSQGRAVILASCLAATLSFSMARAEVAAPRLSITSLDQLRTPLPLPYDETANPAVVNAAVDAAFDRARRSGKRVIVDLGGNWCSWCRILAGVMDLPEAKAFITAHFEVVSVEVNSGKGGNDRNLQILQRFKVKDAAGLPWLVVAEPDGSILASSYEITDDQHHTPQAMIDWIANWSKETPRGSHR